MSGDLPIYTVYSNPSDYPGRHVVRRHLVTRRGLVADAQPLAVVDTLEQARAALPPGLCPLPRTLLDEAQIVESWV